MSTRSEGATRRRFLDWLCLGLGGTIAGVVATPIVGYLLSPLLNPAKQVWRDVGAVGDFQTGATVEVAYQDPSPLPWSGQTAKSAAWLRRNEDGGFTAFAVNCTHLGCPVNWLPDARIFLCPCHGGVFTAQGQVAGGPPLRPLWKHQVRVRNGRVELLTRPLPIG
jgi:menaquinol-cytochrome c reductase iron-sulfur subunit